MSAPTKGSRRSPINSQSESQSNPFHNSSAYNPYFLPAPTNAPPSQGYPILPINVQPATSYPLESQSNPFDNSSVYNPCLLPTPTNAPPSQGYPISYINGQPATSYPLESQSNPFDGSFNFNPYSFPAPTSVPGPMSGPIMSNTHDSINPVNLIGMQNHDIPEEMTGYEGTAAPLQQQIYKNPQPTVFNEEFFRCDQCHQIYSRWYDLTRHKWSHMPIRCDECGHGFNRTHDLARHKQVLHFHTCEVCGRGFTTVVGLHVSFSCADLELRNHTLQQVHISKDNCFKSGSLPDNRDREDKTGPQTKGGPSHNDHPYSL